MLNVIMAPLRLITERFMQRAAKTQVSLLMIVVALVLAAVTMVMAEPSPSMAVISQLQAVMLLQVLVLDAAAKQALL